MDFIINFLKVLYKGQLIDVILIIINRFIKLIYLIIVIIIITAIKLVILFYEQIKYFYGFSKGIITDRNSIFTS